jgi:hypothetical protein
MYRLPSEKPTEYWVHQPVSDGPTDVESYYTEAVPYGRKKQKTKNGNKSAFCVFVFCEAPTI